MLAAIGPVADILGICESPVVRRLFKKVLTARLWSSAPTAVLRATRAVSEPATPVSLNLRLPVHRKNLEFSTAVENLAALLNRLEQGSFPLGGNVRRSRIVSFQAG